MAGLVPVASCCSRTQVLRERGRGEAGSGEGGVWLPLYTVLHPTPFVQVWGFLAHVVITAACGEAPTASQLTDA